MKQSVTAVVVGVSVFAGVGVSLGLIAERESRGVGSAAPAPADAETSYALGYDIGSSALAGLRADSVEVDAASVIEGFTHALHEQASRVKADRSRLLLERLQRQVSQSRAEERLDRDPVFRALVEENARRSEEFHERFAAAPGVKTLPSGVQYREQIAGEGEPPRAEDTVVVSFTGRLIDGQEFASGDHIELIAGEVFSGAREALLNMRPGARWIIAVPPKAGFGIGGREPDVGPNETLLVEATLHEVRRAQ